MVFPGAMSSACRSSSAGSIRVRTRLGLGVIYPVIIDFDTSIISIRAQAIPRAGASNDSDADLQSETRPRRSIRQTSQVQGGSTSPPVIVKHGGRSC